MLRPYLNHQLLEAGCDEAGRGCIAGPVFAAAVILPNDFYDPQLNDSKKLSKKTRHRLRNRIETEAISWAVARVNPHEIDKINILKASIYAMHRAIEKLKMQPDFLLIDGNRFIPFKSIPFECVVKGDGKYSSIAAASILAKTYRDDFMSAFSQRYPVYGWDHNKGYPTEKHRMAVAEYGLSIHHRRSFQCHPRALQGSLF